MSRKPARVWLQGRIRPLLVGVPCVVAGAVFLNFTKKWLEPRLRAVAVPVPIPQLGDTRGLLEDLEAGHVDVLDDLLRKGFALNGVIRGSNRGFCWTGLPPEQGTLLHWASYFSNVSAMELLMNAGVDVETADPTGCKPLHWASVAAKTEGARRLLEAGANVEATAYSWTTPLHWASVNGDGNMVRCLLEAGASVGAIDEGMKTALHHAALRCNTGALQALLETDASLEATDTRGRTPLHCAAERTGIAALRILVDAGANLEARDCQGKTPLHYAIAKGCSVEGVRILIEAGANLYAVDDQGKTPLHYVGDWISGSNVEAVRMLVEAGSKVGATDAERKTPLHCAVKGNPDSVKLLIAAGASLEAADADGKTSLHCAAESATKTEALRILVDAGANLEALDGHEKTPLHYAAASDWNAEGARVLIEAGANLDAVDDQGKTPLHYGAESKLHSDDNAVKALVEAEASLDIADKSGRTPLHSAILNRALSVAGYLTDVGTSARTADASGEAPLHCAALYAVRNLVEALIAAGADVRAANEDGQTPLHCAAESGEEGIAQLLVNAGANVNAQDGDGRTPLHWAAECNKAEVAAILVKAGADVKARDNAGRTAAWISTDSENSSMVELLTGDTSEGHAAAEDGPDASPSAAAMQRTHSLTDSPTGDASGELLRKLLGDSQDDASQFCTDQFEVQSGLRLQSQTSCILSARRIRSMPPMYNFLGEKDDRTVVPIDYDPPATEEPNNPRDAICRLSVGGLVAKKYRIASERIDCEGYMRTAVEMGSQLPVTLRFYEDLDRMKKHASLLKKHKKFSWVCRFVRTINRDGMLPGCIVLRGSLQPLEDWLHTPDVSTDSKLKMLRSLAIALAGLHGQGYVHLDVSPSSIAFCTDDRTCKFLPLDWMTLVENQAEIQSTSRFVAPELLSTRCKLSYQPYQSAADMWSYGVIAYEMLTGDKLYYKEFNRGDDLIRTLQGDTLSRKLNSVIDKRHRHFIKKFLNLDPKKRHTASAALKSSLLRSAAGAGCRCRCAANI